MARRLGPWLVDLPPPPNDYGHHITPIVEERRSACAGIGRDPSAQLIRAASISGPCPPRPAVPREPPLRGKLSGVGPAMGPNASNRTFSQQIQQPRAVRLSAKPGRASEEPAQCYEAKPWRGPPLSVTIGS
jgi:hypothetical protein